MCILQSVAKIIAKFQVFCIFRAVWFWVNKKIWLTIYQLFAPAIAHTFLMIRGNFRAIRAELFPFLFFSHKNLIETTTTTHHAAARMQTAFIPFSFFFSTKLYWEKNNTLCHWCSSPCAHIVLHIGSSPVKGLLRERVLEWDIRGVACARHEMHVSHSQCIRLESPADWLHITFNKLLACLFLVNTALALISGQKKNLTCWISWIWDRSGQVVCANICSRGNFLIHPLRFANTVSFCNALWRSYGNILIRFKFWTLIGLLQHIDCLLFEASVLEYLLCMGLFAACMRGSAVDGITQKEKYQCAAMVQSVSRTWTWLKCCDKKAVYVQTSMN